MKQSKELTNIDKEVSIFKPNHKQLLLFNTVLEQYYQSKIPLYKVIQSTQGLNSETFWKIVNCSEEYKTKLARSREDRTHNFVDELIEIADDSTLTPEDRKVRILAREKVAQMQNPKTYGNKPDNQVNIQLNAPTIQVVSPDDLKTP